MITIEDALASKRPPPFDKKKKLAVLQEMGKNAKVLAAWTQDEKTKIFLNSFHLRHMPTNPDGKSIAKKLVSLEVHVKDLLVPSSRESTLSGAKQALVEYKKLIDVFQAVVDDANGRDDSSGRRRAAGTAVMSKTQMLNVFTELVPNPADLPKSLTTLAVSCPQKQT